MKYWTHLIYIVLIALLIGLLGYQYTTYNEYTDSLSAANVALDGQLVQSKLDLVGAKIKIEHYKMADIALQKLLLEAQDIIAIYESAPQEGLHSEITQQEIDMIAQTVYGEAVGCNTYEQSLVIWCILNRLDSGKWGYRITNVLTAKEQFHGYSSKHPVDSDIRLLVEDVIYRWEMEKLFGWNVGRTLPADIMYFHSGKNENAGHNLFYKYVGTAKEYYNWRNKSNPYN